MSSSGHIQTPTHKNWEHAQIPPVGMCGRIVCGFQIFTSHQLYPGNPCMQNYRSKLKKHKLSPFPLKIAVSKKKRSFMFFQIMWCSVMSFSNHSMFTHVLYGHLVFNQCWFILSKYISDHSMFNQCLFRWSKIIRCSINLVVHVIQDHLMSNQCSDYLL